MHDDRAVCTSPDLDKVWMPKTTVTAGQGSLPLHHLQLYQRRSDGCQHGLTCTYPPCGLQDFFKLGLIPADTDFSIFADPEHAGEIVPQFLRRKQSLTVQVANFSDPEHACDFFTDSTSRKIPPLCKLLFYCCFSGWKLISCCFGLIPVIMFSVCSDLQFRYQFTYSSSACFELRIELS